MEGVGERERQSLTAEVIPVGGQGLVGESAKGAASA